jgi:hypothetical protein
MESGSESACNEERKGKKILRDEKHTENFNKGGE